MTGSPELSRGSEQRLQSQHLVVVGGANGIGARVVAAAAAAGARVTVLDRASAHAPTDGVAYRQVDIREPRSVTTEIDTARSDLGPVTSLVYAAGVHDGYAQVADATEELREVVMDVNVLGALRIVQDVAPEMIESGFGRIVLFGSIAGHVAGAGGVLYTMSKHAVAGLVKHLAVELGPHGITTNEVAPGSIGGTAIRATITDQVSRTSVSTSGGLGNLTADEFSKVYPVGRIGDVDAVAPTVLHLLDPSSWFINGATLTVDGGYTAR